MQAVPPKGPGAAAEGKRSLLNGFRPEAIRVLRGPDDAVKVQLAAAVRLMKQQVPGGEFLRLSRVLRRDGVAELLDPVLPEQRGAQPGAARPACFRGKKGGKRAQVLIADGIGHFDSPF